MPKPLVSYDDWLAESKRRTARREKGLPLHDGAVAPDESPGLIVVRRTTFDVFEVPVARERRPPESFVALGREFVEQVTLFDFIDDHVAEYPELEEAFAVPNAGRRSPQFGAAMVRAGLRKGVPDVILPVPRGAYCGLALELKASKGRIEEEQVTLHARWRSRGWCVCLCVGADGAIAELLRYLKEPGAAPRVAPGG